MTCRVLAPCTRAICSSYVSRAGLPTAAHLPKGPSALVDIQHCALHAAVAQGGFFHLHLLFRYFPNLETIKAAQWGPMLLNQSSQAGWCPVLAALLMLGLQAAHNMLARPPERSREPASWRVA